jgi:hypothetical protein
MKGSLSITGDALGRNVCDRAGDGEDINIQENIDLGNGVSLEREMLSQGGVLN